MFKGLVSRMKLGWGKPLLSILVNEIQVVKKEKFVGYAKKCLSTFVKIQDFRLESIGFSYLFYRLLTCNSIKACSVLVNCFWCLVVTWLSRRMVRKKSSLNLF